MSEDQYPINSEKMNEIINGIHNVAAGHNNGDILAAVCWVAIDHAADFVGPKLSINFVQAVLESVHNGYRTQKNG
jgi:hypothetical protein